MNFKILRNNPSEAPSILQNGEQHKILKIAAQFSIKLAQFFDTILKSKFAMGGGGWLLKPPWGISPEGTQHKI